MVFAPIAQPDAHLWVHGLWGQIRSFPVEASCQQRWPVTALLFPLSWNALLLSGTWGRAAYGFQAGAIAGEMAESEWPSVWLMQACS